MALIALPSCPEPEWWMVTLRFLRDTTVNRSRFSFGRQVLPSGNSMWSADVAIGSLGPGPERTWRAFMFNLFGQANTFRLPVVSADQTTANALVRGAGQSGYSLIMDGLGTSRTILKAGSYLTVGGHLIVLGADLVTNSSGIATATLTTPLRTVPADNAAIELRRPYMTAAMSEDTIQWSSDGYDGMDLAFSCEEAF